MSTLIGNFAFNDSRIGTILKAETLDEAQRMGLIDQVIDFFRGGVKRTAIEALFNEITHADQGTATAPALKQLARFETLLNMVKPEYLDKFSLGAKADPQSGTWSYAFHANGMCIASATEIDLERGHDFAAFQDGAMLARAKCILGKQGKAFPPALEGPRSLQGQFNRMNETAGEIGAFDADIATKFIMLAAALPDPEIRMDMRLSARRGYMLIMDQQIIHAGVVPNDLHAERRQFADVAVAAVHVTLNQFLKDAGGAICDPESFVQGNMQCMADGRDAQARLRDSLDDPAFSRSRFTGCRDAADGHTFLAEFGEQSLVFSNRPPTRNELRGECLKDLLRNSDYATLREITARGHLTEHDNLLVYALTPIKSDFMAANREYLSDDEARLALEQVRGIKVGNTTLGALWQLPPAPASPAPGHDTRHEPAGYPFLPVPA